MDQPDAQPTPPRPIEDYDPVPPYEIPKERRPDYKPTPRYVIVVGCIFTVIIGLFYTYSIVMIPQYRRYHREYHLRWNVKNIRTSIAAFKADTGKYPVCLADLAATNATALVTKIRPGTYKGPYLFAGTGIGGSGVPPNPLTGLKPDEYSTSYPSRLDPVVSHHWRYNPKTGTVHSAVPGVAIDGTPFIAL